VGIENGLPRGVIRVRCFVRCYRVHGRHWWRHRRRARPPGPRSTHEIVDPGDAIRVLCRTAETCMASPRRQARGARDRAAVLYAYDATNVAMNSITANKTADAIHAALATRFSIPTLSTGDSISAPEAIGCIWIVAEIRSRSPLLRWPSKPRPARAVSQMDSQVRCGQDDAGGTG